MNIGIIVTPSMLAAQLGSVPLTIKEWYEKAVGINQWLLNNPPTGSPAVDPLTQAPFSYTADEAVLIRGAYADLAFQKQSGFDSSANVKELVGLGYDA